MIDNIVFKVLPAGEGKTRWLISRAYEESGMGNQVFLLSSNPAEYEKFIMYYRTEYSMSCPVKFANSLADIPLGSIVLIDNFERKKMFNLEELKTRCKNIFATITGIIG